MKLKPIILLLLISIVSFLSLFIYLSVQSRPAIPKKDTSHVKGSNVEVLAKVGEYYLSVSGYVSPYASILMTSDGVFLRSAVADENGDFSISQVLIKPGFTSFCLTAIDVKKIGESETCFTIAPANSDIVMTDLFLPPTLGLARTEIAENASTTAFGYTMPGALVTLRFSNGKTIIVQADETGYYTTTIEGFKAGSYEVYATAEYEGKPSLAPTKFLQFKTLSLVAQTGKSLESLWDRFWNWLVGLGLGLLWIALAILILIIILIVKLWPGKFSWLLHPHPKFIVFPSEHKREKPQEDILCLRYCERYCERWCSLPHRQRS